MKKFKYEKYDYSNIEGCCDRWTVWNQKNVVYEPIRDLGWEIRFTLPNEVRESAASTAATYKGRKVGATSVNKLYTEWLSLHDREIKIREKKAKFFRPVL